MTTHPVTLTDNVMDFSLGRTSLKFRIDDDVFEATPDIATDLALHFVSQAEKLESDEITPDEQINIIHSLFRMLLFPESADRFIKRLSDTSRPIGPQTFTKIIEWLFGEYGMRPTESGSDSSPGPANLASGTSSTVSSSDAASTSHNSALIAS